MSSKLPKGWIETSLSICCYITMGQSPPSNTYNFEKKGLPFFQGKAEFGYKYPVVVKYCSDPKRIAQANDILLSVRAPVGPTNRAKELCCIGRGLAAIRSWLDDSQQYVHYYLISKENWFSNQGSGSTFKAIGKEFLHDLPIPLPPLNEQKRIVAKLDAIMPRIEVVKERLDRVPEAIRRFRQSVLTAAVTGKLTEQWREAHPEMESAEKLLERIIKDKNNVRKNNTVPVKSPSFFDCLEPTWAETTVGVVCENLTQGWSPKCKNHPVANETSWGVLKTTSIQPMKFLIDENKELPAKLEARPNLQLQVNDLLITRAGPRIRAGVSCLVRSVKPRIMICDKMYRVKLVTKAIEPLFAEIYLNSFEVLSIINQMKTGISDSGVNITQAGFLAIPLALPPLEEQREIVRQVERLFALADKVEAHYQQAKERVDKLSQSLLAKAFRGELVPQDPNDEPAGELLKHIEEERSKLEAELKRIRKKR